MIHLNCFIHLLYIQQIVLWTLKAVYGSVSKKRVLCRYNRSDGSQPWCSVLKSEDIMLAIVLLDTLKLFVVICYLRIMNYSLVFYGRVHCTVSPASHVGLFVIL